MRETISNFRFQLRRKNEKLISCTKDIRRKLRTTQSQLHLLVDERAELTAKVSNVLPKTFPENWDSKAPPMQAVGSDRGA